MGCCCRSKSSGGGCCCGRRGATVAFGLLGLLLASAVITPPVYIYKTDQDFTKMFPIFKFGRQYLAQIAGGDPNLTGGITETSTSAATAVSTQAKEGKWCYFRNLLLTVVILISIKKSDSPTNIYPKIK